MCADFDIRSKQCTGRAFWLVNVFTRIFHGQGSDGW